VSGLALLCPGQGGQHAAMLEILAASPTAQAVLREAEPIVPGGLRAALDGGGERLFQNDVAQPLVCATTLAAWAGLRARLPAPRLVAGYSLGELSAHGCAEALPPREAVALAAARAAAMDRAARVPSGLLAVRGLPRARLRTLAAGCGAEEAIDNGPDHLVLGGTEEALACLADLALAAGARTVLRLPIGLAAHTSLLAGAVGPFADALARSALGTPRVPVLAGVEAAPIRDRAHAVSALSRQLAGRIAWADCLAAAAELGCTVFLELGPGAALARMAGELLPAAAARSVADFRSLEGIAAWVERALAR
jgi:[acyl-carrier-protein] S-malonyltransferase